MSIACKGETYRRFFGENSTATNEEKATKVKKSLAKVVVFFENLNVRKIEERPHYDVSFEVLQRLEYQVQF